MMRLGSAWFDVEKQITAVTEKGLDPRNFIICTDDCHSGTLVEEGHVNRALRYAISYGCDPLVALQMATINTATHFGLEREIGSITPGRRADVIFTDDLTSLPINRVFARGVSVAEGGKITVDCPHLDWPAHAKATMHMGKTIVPDDFIVKAPEGANSVTAKVIGIVENQAPTKALTRDLSVSDGIVQTDEAQDVAQVALVERHKGTGGVVNGFVNGFGYTGQMAMASTVAHDSHHMIVVGTSHDDMALAANRLAEVGGGMCVYQGGKELALVELPVAGLMSDAPATEVAEKAKSIIDAWRPVAAP